MIECVPWNHIKTYCHSAQHLVFAGELGRVTVVSTLEHYESWCLHVGDIMKSSVWMETMNFD